MFASILYTPGVCRTILKALLCSLVVGLGMMPSLSAADAPGTPRELAHRICPKATAWKETNLSSDTVLLRGSWAESASGRDMHMYLAVQTKQGVPRLMLTHVVAAAADQYARFELKGAEVRAYHANGTLLARVRMWETPPAQYAGAPELVSLRLVGVEPGIVIAEAENLTRFPVVLRRGKVYLIEYEGNKVRLNNLSLHSEECRLQPGECRRMKLRIASKRVIFPSGLLENKRVELVYRAKDNQLCGAEIAPAWILQYGMPQLNDQGYAYPIRLRDDFAVVLESGMGGFAMYRLAMYQLNNGVWFHSGYLNISGNYAPREFEIEHNQIRVLDYRERSLGIIAYPGIEAFHSTPEEGVKKEK